MITGEEVYTPTTGQANTPQEFHVNGSTVVYLAPSSGETLTENDSFELRRMVAASRSIKVVHEGADVLLGANNPQFEVLIRGTYIVKKILDTTESVGAYVHYGIEVAPR